MADVFLQLSAEDRRDALGVAADRSGRPTHLLEKDVWVVWALATLYAAPLGEHLVFKGGTSLSKAYQVIRRFSEDVDLTYDIRAIAPDLVGDNGEGLPKTRSEEKRWSSEVRRRLPAWVAETVQPVIETALAVEGLAAAVRIEDEKLFIDYEATAAGSGYVAPSGRLADCERAKDDVPPGLVGARNRQQKMTPYPQKASPVRNRRQLTSLVSEVASRWTDEPLPPRPLSAVRGSISVPPRGPLVSFESSIERDFLMFCRTSHRVTAVYAQRLVIDFQDVKRGAARRYTPDFVVEVDAAAGLSWRRAVVEVKTHRDLWRSRRMMRAPYAAARTWAAGQEGTIFRVVTDRMMSGEWLASTRLLSGHLDKPFDVQFEQDCVAFLQQRDSYRISEILALAQQRGLNPQALLPALYRMVARGQLSLDRGQPIGPQTWVTVVGSQKRL